MAQRFKEIKSVWVNKTISKNETWKENFLPAMKKKRGLKSKREKRNFKAVNKKARGKQNFFSFSDFF